MLLNNWLLLLRNLLRLLPSIPILPILSRIRTLRKLRWWRSRNTIRLLILWSW